MADLLVARSHQYKIPQLSIGQRMGDEKQKTN